MTGDFGRCCHNKEFHNDMWQVCLPGLWGPASSAGMAISEGSVPFWASAVSGRKQGRGEGPAGVGGQRPGSYPLGGGRGRSPGPGEQQPPKWGAGRAPLSSGGFSAAAPEPLGW